MWSLGDLGGQDRSDGEVDGLIPGSAGDRVETNGKCEIKRVRALKNNGVGRGRLGSIGPGLDGHPPSP
jgi:hypothetical protein